MLFFFFFTHGEDFDVRPVAHLLDEAQWFPLGDGDGAQDGEGRAVQRLTHCPDEGLAEEFHFADLVDDKHLPAASIRRRHLGGVNGEWGDGGGSHLIKDWTAAEPSYAIRNSFISLQDVYHVTFSVHSEFYIYIYIKIHSLLQDAIHKLFKSHPIPFFLFV